MAELLRKLGIKSRHRVVLLAAPADVAERLVSQSPPDVTWQTAVAADPADIILFWPAEAGGLAGQLAALQRQIVPDGAIWGVVPKKKYVGEPGMKVSWDALQAAALETDLVDNKIVSIDEKSYATRLVIRRERRAAFRGQAGEGA